MPDTARSPLAHLTVPAVLVVMVGLGLIWWLGRKDTPIETAEPPETGQPSMLVEHESPPAPAADPGDDIPEPQAEAAALKQEAVAVANRVAEAYPDNALSHALLGSACYNTGQSEEAIRHLRRCLELDPGQAEAYEIMARVAYERGELEESVRLSEESLQRGPANPEVLNQLARALMDLGRTTEAAETLRQAVQLPRPTSQSFYLLGQASLQSGNHAEAKENFQRAIALLPDHTQAFFGLYTACMRLGETEEADRYREQFLKLEEQDRHTLTDRSVQQDTLSGLPMVRQTVARTLFGAAQIHQLHGATDQAGELYRRSAALDADNPMYRAVLEAFYVQRNALTEGVKAFQELAATQPENILNHFFLGRLHDRLQQIEPAERAYRTVQQLAPDRPEGYRALADLYVRANIHLTEAQALARKAVELEPIAPHYYLLALALMSTNDRAGAIAAMEQAIALNPNETRYRSLLEELRKDL